MGAQSSYTAMAPVPEPVEASPFAEILAQFSERTRASTLKRLRLVRPNDRAWRPKDGLLSFADILTHLVHADRWLINLLDGTEAGEVESIAGLGKPGEWDRLMEALVSLGAERTRRFAALTDHDLFEREITINGNGVLPLPQFLMRYCLDHEIQLRGSLQLALKLRYK